MRENLRKYLLKKRQEIWLEIEEKKKEALKKKLSKLKNKEFGNETFQEEEQTNT